MPNQTPIDIECKILKYVKEAPTHGPSQESAMKLSTEK
jgi:hypothetical protein